jgi:hypothetical protein
MKSRGAIFGNLLEAGAWLFFRVTSSENERSLDLYLSV